MKMNLVAVVVVCALVGKTLGSCPHEDEALESWSSLGTWTLNGQKPTLLEEVVVDKPILLDEVPPELTSITITETGKLVFSPNHGDLRLKLRYILVHGELHIGSDTCKYTGNVRITLTGIRNENNDAFKVTDFGEKFIGVENNGVLQIYGQNKLSWTKLDATVTPPKYKLDQITSGIWTRGMSSKGLAMHVMNVGTSPPSVSSHGGFTLYGTTEDKLEKARQFMIKRLMETPDGHAVMIAVQRRFVAADHLDLMDALESIIFGDKPSRSIGLRNIKNEAYAMIFIKGDPTSFVESEPGVAERNDQFIRVSMDMPDVGLKLSAHSRLDILEEAWNSDKLFYTNFRAMKIDDGYPIITLADDATSWRTGDKVVFTSTNYKMVQAEVATIVNCPRPSVCNNNQIRVDAEFEHTHFGRMITNVDMRAEVGLLTRNIVIEGEMQKQCTVTSDLCVDPLNFDTHGGHIKINKNFGSVAVEGVELYHMGQPLDPGSYPLHFHMCGDTTGRTAYFGQNSIHHAFIRCITIHGTHNVKVVNNMCFDTFGHGYFLEDGGEKYTTLDGNLGANIRRGGILESDKKNPAVFWLTNPHTTVINNIAAGSDGTGFWYVFPESPLGRSAGLGFMAEDEARHTPLGRFENNAAHSCQERGLNVDGKLLDVEGRVGSNNDYKPRENPHDPDSNPAEVALTKFTGFKNRRHNAWLRGGYYKVSRFSLSDSSSGLTMLKGSLARQFVQDSVIIGESENKGDSDEIMHSKDRVLGFRFYDGPVYLNGIWFNGFKNSSNDYCAGAISFKPAGPVAKDVNSLRDVRFGFVDSSAGNRLFDGMEGQCSFKDKADPDRTHSFRDMDGSLTGSARASIVRPGEFYVTDQCEYRQTWQMAVCPLWYTKIKLSSNGFDVYRSDKPGFPERMNFVFMAALQYDFYYTVQFVDEVPTSISLSSQSISDGNGVIIGVCLPSDATFDLKSMYPVRRRRLSDWIVATSIEDLKVQDGAYFYDSQSGALYIRLFNNVARDEFDDGSCPGPDSQCPSVRIDVSSSNYKATKCNMPSWVPYDENAKQYVAPSLRVSTKTYSSEAVPMGWGAGSTVPFSVGDPVDGGYSKWTEWTECSRVCAGGTRFRQRYCNNPLPAYGGLSCVGESEQIGDCNTQACIPVNAGFSEWSEWSECTCVPGSTGFRTRSRVCNNPVAEFGGKHCEGAVEETTSCAFDTCDYDLVMNIDGNY